MFIPLNITFKTTFLENRGIDPSISYMLSERSTIWASSPPDFERKIITRLSFHKGQFQICLVRQRCFVVHATGLQDLQIVRLLIHIYGDGNFTCIPIRLEPGTLNTWSEPLTSVSNLQQERRKFIAN